MRFQMSVSLQMAKALEEELKERMLGSVQETMRSIVADYFMIKRMQISPEIRRKALKVSSNKEEIIIKQNPLIV